MECKYCKNKEAIKYSKYSTGEFCSRECARGYSTLQKRDIINKIVSKKLSINKICKCGNIFIGYKKKYCSNECALKYRVRRRKEQICMECGISFIPKKKNREKCCSVDCKKKVLIKNGNIGGIKSAISQNRRSKNEIYFYNLCKKEYNEVLNNETLFNGWDADIIILNYKIAVLWNGKWHYEKITKNHSIKQVENRDRIKIKEIESCGYIPYVVKDMGRENKDFVEKEFEKLTGYISSLS